MVTELLKLASSVSPTRRKRSSLDEYEDDLRKLRNDGYTLAQISKMLSDLGVNITPQGIHDFLKRRSE